MIIGRDERNRVMLVVGKEKRFSLLAEEGWKIINLKGPIRALAFDRKARIRPVPAGVSIGQVDITAGTSGGVVEYQNQLHGITNSHIVTPHPESEKPPDRLEILQPARYDGGNVLTDCIGLYVKHAKISLAEKSWCRIARLKDFLYNKFAGVLGRATRSYSLLSLQEEENCIDAGIYEPVNPDVVCDYVVDDNGNIVPTKYVCGLLFAGSTIDNIMVACRADYIEKMLGVKFLNDIHIPEIGEIIWKSGRSTGLTFGETLANDMTTVVEYNGGVGTMRHCIVARVSCAGGDSGSKVFIKKE